MTDRDRAPDIRHFPLPEHAEARLLLVCARRIAAHGIDDAHASLLMLRTFRLGYRRQLVLLRAFMLEVAQTSKRSIAMAPCCAMAMTADEVRLIDVLNKAVSDPAGATRQLETLTGGGRTCHALSLAVALDGNAA